jgi:hypothetical protein
MRKCVTAKSATNQQATILHLLDPSRCGDAGVLACRAEIERSRDEFAHQICLIGCGDDERRAERLGLSTTDRVGCGMIASRCIAGLQHLADDRFGPVTKRAGRPEIVCAWSLRALWLASRAFAFRQKRMGVLLSPPRWHDGGIMPLGSDEDGFAFGSTRARESLNGAVVVRVDGGGANEWGGIRDVDVRQASALDMMNGVATHSEANRQHARESMGIGAGELVVLLLGDGAAVESGCLVAPMPSSADALRLSFLGGLSFVAGVRVTAVVPRDAHNLRRAARFVRLHSRRWGLVATDATLPEMLHAADVAVVLPPEAGRTETAESATAAASAIAVHMGVPLVCAAGGEGAALLSSAAEQSGSAGAASILHCIARDRDTKSIARVVLMLAESASMRRAVGEALASARERTPISDSVLAPLWREWLTRVSVHPGLPAPKVLAHRGVGTLVGAGA